MSPAPVFALYAARPLTLKDGAQRNFYLQMLESVHRMDASGCICSGQRPAGVTTSSLNTEAEVLPLFFPAAAAAAALNCEKENTRRKHVGIIHRTSCSSRLFARGSEHTQQHDETLNRGNGDRGEGAGGVLPTWSSCCAAAAFPGPLTSFAEVMRADEEERGDGGKSACCSEAQNNEAERGAQTDRERGREGGGEREGGGCFHQHWKSSDLLK